MLQPTLLTPDRALLTGLIDYAGLFPPASLGMAGSIAEFREARTGPNAWVVHRFLCPASRLQELAGHLASTMRTGEQFWSIGCIVDGPLGESIAAAQDFEAEMAPGASTSAVEVRLRSAETALGSAATADAVEGIADAVATLGEATMAYVEVVPETAADDVAAIAEVARQGRPVAAKIRCGGVTADAVPTSESLAGVLMAVASHDVALKATAGLHHPVRRFDADLGADMHGFLNLAVAHHLARSGADVVEVVAALEERDPDAFGFGAATMSWGSHTISSRLIQTERAGGLHGFGSCSFTEPIEDLVALGIGSVVK